MRALTRKRAGAINSSSQLVTLSQFSQRFVYPTNYTRALLSHFLIADVLSNAGGHFLLVMALNGSSSSSTLRRILSRWKRDSTTTTRASNVGARKMSSTKRFTEPSASATLGSAYSESVKAGKKWKMQARKQMNKRDTVMVEMMTVDELNGQLLPIHKVLFLLSIETMMMHDESYRFFFFSLGGHGRRHRNGSPHRRFVSRRRLFNRRARRNGVAPRRVGIRVGRDGLPDPEGGR